MIKFPTPLQGWVCLVILLAVNGQVLAQLPQTHELHIQPDSQSIPLRPAPWPNPADGNYRVTVTSPPSFGVLDAETYRPNEEFQSSTVDRFSIQIENIAAMPPQVSNHTFLLSSMKLDRRDILAETDFEPGPASDWQQEWNMNDANQQLEVGAADAIAGEQSLKATVVGANTAWLSPTGTIGGGGTGYGATGGVVVKPPFDSHLAAGNMVIASLGKVQVQLDYDVDPQTGVGQIRLRAVSKAGKCGVCATPWRRAPAGPRIDFTLWAGVKVMDAFHGKEGPWGIKFAFKPTTEPEARVDWIEGDFNAEDLDLAEGSFRVGIVEPSFGLGGLEVILDELELWQEYREFATFGHVGESFDDGDAHGWQTQGTVGQVTQQANDWVWSVDVDALAGPESSENSVLIDTSPGDSAPGQSALLNTDKAISAMMRVDLSEISLQEGDSIQLLRGSSSENLDGGLNLSLLLTRLDGEYKLRGRARDDHGVTRKTPFHSLQTDRFDLTVQWRAGSESAGDGAVRFWVDGELAGEKTAIDNTQQRIEAVAFGAHRSILNGPGARGNLHLDDLASFAGQ